MFYIVRLDSWSKRFLSKHIIVGRGISKRSNILHIHWLFFYFWSITLSSFPFHWYSFPLMICIALLIDADLNSSIYHPLGEINFHLSLILSCYLLLIYCLVCVHQEMLHKCENTTYYTILKDAPNAIIGKWENPKLHFLPFFLFPSLFIITFYSLGASVAPIKVKKVVVDVSRLKNA